MYPRTEELRPREGCGNMPWRDSSTLRDTVRAPREVWAPAAASGHASPRAWNSLSQQAPRGPRRPAPSGAALCALRVLSLLDPRAWPAAPPPGSQLLPRLPRVPVPASSSPAPPPVARALPAPPPSPRVRPPQPIRFGAACADSNGGS